MKVYYIFIARFAIFVNDFSLNLACFRENVTISLVINNL